ncbi:hypothetical protein KCK52_000654 [Clostridium perfringens]|nr:hypothetical protein [Clostridium perfringens]
MAVDKKKRNRIIINFKDTKEEMELYEKLLKHSNPASYIKDICKKNLPSNEDRLVVKLFIYYTSLYK